MKSTSEVLLKRGMKYQRNFLPGEGWSFSTKNFCVRNFMSQEIISYHKKKFPVTGRNFLSKENISVTGRHFLSQDEISCHTKKFPRYISHSRLNPYLYWKCCYIDYQLHLWPGAPTFWFQQLLTLDVLNAILKPKMSKITYILFYSELSKISDEVLGMKNSC